MSIAALIRSMATAGAPPEAIALAVEAIEAAQSLVEATRAAARDRKRRQRAAANDPGSVTVTGQSRDAAGTVADTPPLSPPSPKPPRTPQEPQPPHTPPCAPRARKADQFPRPDFADPQHWADILAARKLKHLANTPSAHAKLLRDVAKYADDDWPPGRIIQHAAEKGWGGIYDPRNSQEHRNGRQLQPTNSLRGSRPDPSLDMLRQAQAEIRASEDQGDDRSTWAAIPSYRAN